MGGFESYIFRTVVRLIFFVINVVALYLLLRGHDAPGGGFIAGLATAISLILLSLAVGIPELHAILRFDPVRVAAGGLLVSIVVAVLPTAFGRPVFEHRHFHLDDLPGIDDWDLGTPLLFDAGVYLVVVGITCKIIFVLAKSTQGFRALVSEEEQRYSSILEQPIEDQAAEDGLDPRDTIHRAAEQTDAS